MSEVHFTEPTTQYWQEILPVQQSPLAPWKYGYPAVLPDSKILVLPIRQLPTPDEAVASLILNQASAEVASELAAFLADIVSRFKPDVIIGLPTLGLTLAMHVAQKLGHKRYVPLGYSRKFWYSDALSTSVSSITSPSGVKPIYLDPNQLSLVKSKRVVIVDDAVSSGTTLKSTWDFLESEKVGCEIVGCGVVMKQGEKWKSVLENEKVDKMVWVFESPLLKKVKDGWDVRE